MPQASESFARALHNIDPLLSVRWGPVAQCWIIERKAVVGDVEKFYLSKRFERLSKMVKNSSVEDMKPIAVNGGFIIGESKLRSQLAKQKREKLLTTFEGVAEEHSSAINDRRVVIFTDRLDDKVFNTLCLGDISRYGGYSRYADEQEASVAKAEAEAERVKANTRRAMHGEVFDALNFIWEKKESKLLAGEKDMNVLLHGQKRSQPALVVTE